MTHATSKRISSFMEKNEFDDFGLIFEGDKMNSVELYSFNSDISNLSEEETTLLENLVLSFLAETGLDEKHRVNGVLETDGEELSFFGDILDWKECCFSY